MILCVSKVTKTRGLLWLLYNLSKTKVLEIKFSLRKFNSMQGYKCMQVNQKILLEVCGEGHTGVLCDFCKENYAKLGNRVFIKVIFFCETTCRNCKNWEYHLISCLVFLFLKLIMLFSSEINSNVSLIFFKLFLFSYLGKLPVEFLEIEFVLQNYSPL